MIRYGAARWSSLREGAAILTDFVPPKDLAQSRLKPRPGLGRLAEAKAVLVIRDNGRAEYIFLDPLHRSP